MPKTKNKKKVAVALSGGVDSSVAAAILKKQGYDVAGVHIKIWSDPDIPCTLKQDRHDAVRVSTELKIPFQTWDFTKEYRSAVVKYMIQEYTDGRTPNPDVMCNQEIKFGLFLKQAIKKGFDFVSTGHHSRIIKDKKDYKLLTGKDKNKDQSYFLWPLTQEQLRYCLFPIGEYTKTKVRKLAKKFKLSTAEKKDSQGICFIGKINVREFLKKYIPLNPGPIQTTKGQIIGEHIGLSFYTIGQRHGIGVGGGTPYYVAEKDTSTNTLVVSEGAKDEKLFSKQILARDLNWISGKKPDFPIKCYARIRYRQPLQKCRVDKINSDKIRAVFNKPQKAVASGQSIVFYSDDEVLGGGVIE